jgi:hypothetical protein
VSWVIIWCGATLEYTENFVSKFIWGEKGKLYTNPVNELGLSRYFTGCLLRHQKKYPPMRSAITSKGTITAAAIAPPLMEDLLVEAAVVVGLELELVVEDVDVVVLVVVEVLNVEEDVVVADTDDGLKVIPVNTVCNFKSVG